LKISKNDCINFLDVMILFGGQRIIFDHYDEINQIGEIREFPFSSSNVPEKEHNFRLSRTLLLSYPKFHAKNLKFVTDTLLNNCYRYRLYSRQ